MALVRILVDGYSLLHNWPELAPGKARYSAAAREELIRQLTLYRDAIVTPITIVFDGTQPPVGPVAFRSTPELEILYSRAGKSADDLIERATVRLLKYGDVLAVTDDYAERDLVIGMGGMASSCDNFIADIETTLQSQGRELFHHNRRERAGFKAPR